jgi:hypothetical protein
MCSNGVYDRLDLAIFSDTGGEKTKTLEYYNFMIKWQEENNGIPLHVASYKNLEKDLLNQQNSTNNRFASIPAFTKSGKDVGMLRRQCTNEYKISQVNRKYRDILDIGKKRFPITEIWQGITLDEMSRMRIPQEKWKINVYPFCGYKIYPDGKCVKFTDNVKTRNDLMNWYADNNLPMPVKSSCKFCPFHSDANWLDLKKNDPNDFKDAVNVDYSIRDSSKKGIKNQIFIHQSLIPLDKVDFNENQLSIWGNCSDVCDV